MNILVHSSCSVVVLPHMLLQLLAPASRLSMQGASTSIVQPCRQVSRRKRGGFPSGWLQWWGSPQGPTKELVFPLDKGV